jgi:hypothetical protein
VLKRRLFSSNPRQYTVGRTTSLVQTSSIFFPSRCDALGCPVGKTYLKTREEMVYPKRAGANQKERPKERKNTAVRRSPVAKCNSTHNLYMYVQKLLSPGPRGCLLSAHPFVVDPQSSRLFIITSYSPLIGWCNTGFRHMRPVPFSSSFLPPSPFSSFPSQRLQSAPEKPAL